MIAIEGVWKAFDNHQVLRGLDLEIRTGETMVVIGRSGVGKSVLLRHIIGLVTPDQGRIVVDDQDLTGMRRAALSRLRMKCGMLFQGAALFDSLTVRENVGFALWEHTDLGEGAIAEKVEECLRLVGLQGIGDLFPDELSGGMRKRVGLARAICYGPEIMLYDEPTTGVDPIMADAICDLVLCLRDKLQVTSVVVTHDMPSAYKIADRIAMLYEGRIIAVGTPEDIRRTEDPYVRQFITGAATGPITAGTEGG